MSRDRGPVGHAVPSAVPLRLLLGAEVRTVEELLEAQDLHLLPRGLIDQLEMLVDHRLLDRGQAGLRPFFVTSPGSGRSGRCEASLALLVDERSMPEMRSGASAGVRSHSVVRARSPLPEEQERGAFPAQRPTEGPHEDRPRASNSEYSIRCQRRLPHVTGVLTAPRGSGSSGACSTARARGRHAQPGPEGPGHVGCVLPRPFYELLRAIGSWRWPRSRIMRHVRVLLALALALAPGPANSGCS